MASTIPWLSGDSNVQCITSLQIKSYLPFSLCVGQLGVPDYTPTNPINGTEAPSFSEFGVEASVTAIGQWTKQNATDTSTHLYNLLDQSTMVGAVTLTLTSGQCPAASYIALPKNPLVTSSVTADNVAKAWKYFTTTPDGKAPPQSYLQSIVNDFLKMDDGKPLPAFNVSGGPGVLVQMQVSDRSLSLGVAPASSGGGSSNSLTTLTLTRSATLTILPILVAPLPPPSSKTPSSSSSSGASGSRQPSKSGASGEDGGHGSVGVAIGVVGGVAGLILLAAVVVMVARRRARAALPKESVLTDAVLTDANV